MDIITKLVVLGNLLMIRSRGWVIRSRGRVIRSWGRVIRGRGGVRVTSISCCHKGTD